MIRQAVGALIKNNRDEFLLVEKIKYGEDSGVNRKMSSEWDIPKGGVKESDVTLEFAILRELKEETGSDCFKICGRLAGVLQFAFPEYIQQQIGYQKQETTIFLVEYEGEEYKLIPIDDEIKQCKWMKKDELLEALTHVEMKDYLTTNYL
ncbi:MAG: NUDIX hydrolase [Bacillaceae bacterium]|nr:NUDIX hydrolase [Bacillaceae bacterium]